MKRIVLLLWLTITFLNAEISELSDATYEAELKKNSKVVVMFFAPWCGACKEMKPNYIKISKVLKKSATFRLINTDENKKVSEKFGIESLPTTLIFEKGKEVARRVGLLSQNEIMMLVDAKEAITISTKRCQEGDYEMCNDLGVLYRDGEEVKQDYAKALTFYKMVCNSKSIVGCNDLALMYGNAEGVERNASLAIKYYGMSCDAKESIGCYNLGGTFRNGWYGVEKDNSKALGFYDKSCAYGDEESCFELGVMYAEGLGIEKDVKKSLELFKKSCEDGYEDACDRLEPVEKN